ncbi:MAG: EF-P lysine aminoacylase EpmA [Deltaproteobacteria bacterium]|nr:EF-P lysine aminoacylase EpmA [Deltaproteobacteria bacterium]
MDEDWRLAAKAEALSVRAAMLRALRGFFQERNFLEIDTPLRIPAPAPESHIDPIAAGDWFLQTSPELCMKRLLAAGYRNIFQICKCFRARERGDRHLPEFTMLEWYRAGVDYRTLMDDCEALIARVAADRGFGGVIVREGARISLAPPWERLTVREAFARYAACDVERALQEDRFDEIMVEAIEPRLGVERPTFLYEYPASLGALARLKADDPRVAERFELYIAGLELANAFSELTDAAEQRRRFAAVRRDRARHHLPATPMPEPFLEALPRMPEAAGIALGLDRLAMLLTDKASIDAVVAFTPEML